MSRSPAPANAWRTVVVLVGVVTLGIGAVRVLDRQRNTAVAPRNPAASITEEPMPTERLLVGELFPSAVISDTGGRVVPLAAPGDVSVLMINSTSCGFCRESLAELGRLTKGHPLPGLRVLTLEGAADGQTMLAAAGVVGAVLIGPATDAAKVLFTFRIQGTPTFVAVDRQGVVRRLMPGYPGPDELRRWVPVMARSAGWRDDG
jgi:hypothetical protein